MTAHKGFSLIEMMIAVAIIAILAAIAAPTYRDFAIRAKLTEGYSAAMSVRSAVGAAWHSGGIAAIQDIALQYPAPNGVTASKYVRYISVDNTGVITVSVAADAANGIPPQLEGQSMTLTPQVRDAGGYALLAAGLNGKLDWACASDTQLTAASRGMLATSGTLPSRYLPMECR